MGHVDAVFRGEADVSFPRFCRDVLQRRLGPARLGELPLHSYPGLFIRKGDLAVDNAPVHHDAAELALFPAPDRSGFHHAAYQREWRRRTGRATTSFLATFGCPYGCDFCSKPVFGDHVRRRPLDAVFAEIDQLQTLGYDSLWIADDTFTMDLSYLREFCRRMRPRGMTWSCLSRANGIRNGMAAVMREAGCTRVYLGLESGDDDTLRLMNKQVTVQDGAAAAALYHAAGIEVAAFFIVGYPGETPQAIERTFELALSLPLDEISFNVPVPLPGSRLFERLGEPDEGKDWTHENEITFVYPSGIDADLAAAARGRDAARVRGTAGGARRVVRAHIAARHRSSLNSRSVGAATRAAAPGPQAPRRRLSSTCVRAFSRARRILAAEKSPSTRRSWLTSRRRCGRQAWVVRPPRRRSRAVPGRG